MNYPDSVRFLYALGNEIATAKLGLDRIARIAAAMGHPERAFRVIHVAGTNGKGSTCAMIESALRVYGIRTGLYTSPHLAEPTERIRIQGREVSPEAFAHAFETVHGLAQRMLDTGELDAHPTYFETVTAMGFHLFQQEKVDTAVLEVGLGGRLDATNIVQPAVTVITSIDYDHQAFLGHTLEQIAAEKAGILKPGVPAVFSSQRPEASAVIEAKAEDLGIPVVRPAQWGIASVENHPSGNRFRIESPEPMAIDCPLAGAFQIDNALSAVAALRLAGVDARAIESGIARTRWPGRLERVSQSPEVILDGAHNPAAAKALAAHIQRFYAGRRITLIYAAMRDKAVAEITRILFPAADEIIATHPHLDRAARPETIAEIAHHPNLSTADTIEEALARLHNPDVVFITGSLFLVAEARKVLVRDSPVL